MSEATTKLGILVGVDGSKDSDAAVRWAAKEATIRDVPITLIHVMAPVVVNWPVGSLQASCTGWQEENARVGNDQTMEPLRSRAVAAMNMRPRISSS